ncbi:ABC transporter ATP-binding protein ydiF [Thermobacillus xylanilyticus]|jgi:ATP-binding cassette subfamily F protein 3|uniref:ATPase component of ABC transporters with duplicated ATPase domain n=2 Tax=Thermobacillus TaxID=76632 RepID=L0EC57_THECK|nr:MULTISPECIES: ABC-F family ATP-binding cassette domain-containing protein [Thermobacillus]AGA56770.1 ATPase component of ABC transporters with duplicated ATPase domain [Thermobacillus composti KWC4]CAG5076652.1 ABC transporter ATP-binding protein ydiF [Thermobacillus xylanilyticus]
MLLQLSGIAKSFGAKPVLSNISFHVNERERIGIVGVNGAGKSTLLAIIAGELSPDDGVVSRRKGMRIGYLAQSSGLQSDRTIDEEMRAVFADLLEMERELREMEVRIADPKEMENKTRYEELLARYAALSDTFRERGGFEIETRIRSVLHGMGFGQYPPDTPIASLSGGQKTRLALARILLQAPDLLILDEPTNHLDIETLSWLEDYLRGYPGAILAVSHDRYFLDALADSIIEIERHAAKRYTGNYSRYIELKAAEYESALKAYEKQQDEIARMEEFIRRNIVRASTTKRAQSRRKMLERMERIERPAGDVKRASFAFEIDRQTGADVLDVQDLSVRFEGSGRPLFRNVSFQLKRGETVAIAGPNGIGKSTLLKTLLGRIKPETGTVRFGANVKIGYYDQEQSQLHPDNTVLDEVWNAFPHLEEVRIRTVLGNFLFSGDDVLKKISSLSGGEKARVALAKLMLERANVLILDEPTNHLDLYSKEVLETALVDFEGTLLFISHDRYFLNKMAERIIELTPDGVRVYLGNYDDMLEKKREQEELRLAGETAGSTADRTESGGTADAAGARGGAGGGSSYEAEKQAKRQERQRQRRIEQLEAEIEALEAAIAAVEAELADPAVYLDYTLVQEKQQHLDEKRAALEAAFAEWEQLMA